MRFTPSLMFAAAASAVLACDRQPDNIAPTTASLVTRGAEGVLTSRPSLARTLVSQASLKPIITVGDSLPGQGANPDPQQRVWAPIPDGLGAFEQNGDLVLFANHEISSGGVDGKFPFSRVSRLVLDRNSLGVKSGSYAITGAEPGFQFQRLCSASFAGGAEGFGSGWFFTGEENASGGSEGIELAVKNDGSETRKLPALGRFLHENYIAVPGFDNKTVMIGTDDNSPAAFGTALRSELYMYVADNADGVLNGTGKLYVFTSTGATNSGYLGVDAPITGNFVEVPNAASLSATDLQTAVDQLGAFKFVRLEDADYQHHMKDSDSGPTIYFVDTGNLNARCGDVPCDLYGSIYRMDFDRANPTQNARLTLTARSRGVAAGDWASPDNIAVGEHSMMVQEDPAYADFNRPERIWNFKFNENGSLGAPQAIVELENQKFTGNICSDAAGTCWESSGIIDASQWLGEGSWLFDVQAHTLPFSYQDGATTVNISKEGGQLLYLRLPGS